MTEYRFAEGTPEEYILDESEIVSHNPVLAHTGKADARVSCQEIDHLKDLAQYKTRVTYYEGSSAEWTGYLLNASVNERTGNMDLDLDGVALRLEETYPDYESLGGNIQYQSISLSDAIRDYWARTPFDATVYDQSTQIVSNDELLQSADTTAEWQNVTTPADSDPVVIQNGNLELAQTCFTTEGLDRDRDGGIGVENDPAYSGGQALELAGGGNFAEWDFTPAYDIPSSAVGVQVRDEATDTPGIEWSLNGNTIDTIPGGATNLALGWSDIGEGNYSGGDGYTGSDLSAGTTYTLRAENVDPDAGYFIDVVAPYDNRFSYFFDNDNGGSDGYLDGPQLYPDAFDFELDEHLTAYNIESATLETAWNDISNNQAIAVSNNGGETYASSSLSSFILFNFSDPGRAAQVKFTLSRYGSRTTATPQTGFNGQVVQDFTLTADLNDLTVIDQLELSRDHFRNLKTLHEYGDFVWVIDPGGGGLNTLSVESFEKGSQTKPTPDALTEPENITSEVKAESYYNKIRLEGALDDATGTRPTATVKDQTAINNAGREIAPGVLRDLSISTEAGATFRANALLSIAVDNNDRTGRIDAPAGLVLPGYSYTVDLGDGAVEKTLEEADLNASAGQYSGTYHFVPPATISETISELRRNATSFENQV